MWLSSWLPGCARRAVGVQLERPEPRSGEDERAGCRQAAADHRGAGKSLRQGLADGRVAWLCAPDGWWSSEWSHVHPFGACLVAAP